jgi:NDP-sugar pyrophosphorylase family protein
MADGARQSPALGVIMAGGSGERMRASGETTLKPLVPVMGVPLVERNLMAMLRARLTDVRIVVSRDPAAEPIRRWASDRGRALAAAAGARVTVVAEDRPLGNCGGIVLAVGSSDGDAVLVFADNLTDLDLRALCDAHAAAAADLTLAIHSEPFRLPYGVVDTEAGTVVGYREKPSVQVTVASGLLVASARARAALTGPAGVADLTNAVVAHRMATATFPHTALWLDVNDTSKVVAAEAMVRANPACFETYWPAATWSGDGEHAPPDAILIDDLDGSGRPVRIDVHRAQRAAVSETAWRRIQAWRSGER